MSRLMLDTTAYSAFMRGQEEIKSALQRVEEICVNPIILGELLAGFRRGGRLRKNQEELRAFLSSPRVHVLNLDEETAERYAVILDSLWRAGTPIPSNDLWIAASAMQHGLRILTTDAHYRKVAQILVDYVEPP
jgi:predicted nucleic acid-binding protein